jgi:hypothetical protein
MLRRRPTNPSILAWKVVATRNTLPHVKSKQSGEGRLCMVITRNTLPRGIFKPCGARHRFTADSFLSWLLGKSKRCGAGHQCTGSTRIAWWQNLHLQIIAEQGIVKC